MNINLNQIISLILSVITSFPLFISTLKNILSFVSSYLNSNNFIITIIKKILSIIIKILNYIKLPINEQLDELVFTAILNIPSSLIYLTYYFINKNNKLIFNIKHKFILLTLNILITLAIFIFNKNLDIFIE